MSEQVERKTPWTPGPWSVVDYSEKDDYEVLVIHHDSENRVCFMATPGSHGDPAMIAADARLIAAAPEMAEVLTELCVADSFERESELLTKARVLLARIGAS